MKTQGEILTKRYFVSLIICLTVLLAHGTVWGVSGGSGASPDGFSKKENPETFVDMYPTCEEQGIGQDPYVPHQNSSLEPWSPFLAAYTIKYCEIASEYDLLAMEKLDEIVANEELGFLDMIVDLGEFFCYDGFGPCGGEEETLFGSYRQACMQAYDEAPSLLEPIDATMEITDPVLSEFTNRCGNLASQKVKSFKQFAFVLAIQNQAKLLETSNINPLMRLQEQFQDLSKLTNDTSTQITNATRSMDGLTAQAEVTGPTKPAIGDPRKDPKGGGGDSGSPKGPAPAKPKPSPSAPSEPTSNKKPPINPANVAGGSGTNHSGDV